MDSVDQIPPTFDQHQHPVTITNGIHQNGHPYDEDEQDINATGEVDQQQPIERKIIQDQ
ncbi:unnamed protein product, partial [Didymodactylos carnosus]